MDSDKGKTGTAEEVAETSFNAGDDPVTHDESSQDEAIRSSRHMPVADHLRSRFARGQTETVEEDIAPPPSYQEAIASQDVSGNGIVDNSPEEGAAINDEAPLSHEELELIMQGYDIGDVESGERVVTGGDGDDGPDQALQGQGQPMKYKVDNYVPRERRVSLEEAMEMAYRKSLELPSSEPPPEDHLRRASRTEEPNSGFIAPMEIEEGRRDSSREDYECEGWGPLDEVCTRLCRFLRRQSTSRLILFSLLVMAGIGLLLFISLFPASFVYVNYHEIALKQSKTTNVVDRGTVYYPGCYVLGPDSKLLFFTGSVHNIVEEITVFTKDTITVTMRFSAHYFIRPEEVGQLFSLFHFDYNDVFVKIVTSTLRNMAGASLTVDNFRFNRTSIETQMHIALRKRLGGDCCPKCCKDRSCQSNTYCSMCKTDNCDQGYHVDVRFFHLLSVAIPNAVFERLLYRTILQVREEKEFFVQGHAEMVIETKQKTEFIKNEAKEIVSGGQFEADKIKTLSEADKEKVVQSSYATALKGLFSRLNLTQEDHQLSLMMVRALEESSENLYSGFGFEHNTLYAP